MKNFSISLCALGLACAFATAVATTVIPPTFDELVGQAEVIFQGTVTEVASQWTGEGGQRHIMTYVTFQVEEAVKGDPGVTYTMRMLGGTVDGTTMEVTDSPKFKVGEREILFIEHNGSQFIPLVGIMHGRFHVMQDNATKSDVIVKNDGEGVTNLADLGKEDPLSHADKSNRAAAGSEAEAKPFDAASFKSAIRAKLKQS